MEITKEDPLKTIVIPAPLPQVKPQPAEPHVRPARPANEPEVVPQINPERERKRAA